MAEQKTRKREERKPNAVLHENAKAEKKREKEIGRRKG